MKNGWKKSEVELPPNVRAALEEQRMLKEASDKACEELSYKISMIKKEIEFLKSQRPSGDNSHTLIGFSEHVPQPQSTNLNASNKILRIQYPQRSTDIQSISSENQLPKPPQSIFLNVDQNLFQNQSQNGSKSQFMNGSQNISRNNSQNIFLGGSQNLSDAKSQNVFPNRSQDVSKDISQNISKSSFQSVSNSSSQRDQTQNSGLSLQDQLVEIELDEETDMKVEDSKYSCLPTPSKSRSITIQSSKENIALNYSVNSKSESICSKTEVWEEPDIQSLEVISDSFKNMMIQPNTLKKPITNFKKNTQPFQSDETATKINSWLARAEVFLSSGNKKNILTDAY